MTWVHAIPWYLKPAVPGFFNLCNSAMRWGSLIYVAASMAEMLISGLELLLSVVAARCIRKRRISWSRWVGVLVVALGLALVRLANRDSDRRRPRLDRRRPYRRPMRHVGDSGHVRGCVEINLHAIEQTQSRERHCVGRGAPEI